MRKLVVTGWVVGFQKLEFTKLLRKELSYSLSEAKAVTDAVLDGKPLHLKFTDKQFDLAAATMNRLGAVFHEEDL